MQPDAQKWLDFAHEDLKMAQLAMRESLFNQVCFHAHQSAEKILKGLLVNSEILSPKTHKLCDLLSMLPVPVPEQLFEKLLFLDRFYIPTRYPDAIPDGSTSGMPNRAEAQEALFSVSELEAWMRQLKL